MSSQFSLLKVIDEEIEITCNRTNPLIIQKKDKLFQSSKHIVTNYSIINSNQKVSKSSTDICNLSCFSSPIQEDIRILQQCKQCLYAKNSDSFSSILQISNNSNAILENSNLLFQSNVSLDKNKSKIKQNQEFCCLNFLFYIQYLFAFSGWKNGKHK